MCMSVYVCVCVLVAVAAVVVELHFVASSILSLLRFAHEKHRRRRTRDGTRSKRGQTGTQYTVTKTRRDILDDNPPNHQRSIINAAAVVAISRNENPDSLDLRCGKLCTYIFFFKSTIQHISCVLLRRACECPLSYTTHRKRRRKKPYAFYICLLCACCYHRI